MPGVYLTQAQEQKRDDLGFTAGLQGAAIGLGLGVVATIVTFRRSPDFRALSRPIQAVLPTSGTQKKNKENFGQLIRCG